MLVYIVSLLLILPSLVFGEELKQFPDDGHIYRPRVDTGMGKYQAKSLHGTNQLVLTFDDGPHIEYTGKILDLLKEYNAKATFFVLTSKINENNRYLIDRIINEGHFLSSHDSDHDNNNNESEETYKKELKKSIELIEEITNELGVFQREKYYRFPYGAYGKSRYYHHMNVIKEVSEILYGENCINFAFWDIDTNDWVPTMSSAEVAQNVKANMEGGTAYTFRKASLANGRRGWVKVPYQIRNPIKGGVVLMHDVQKRTIEGTRLILKMAQAKNWSIIPLNEVEEFDYKNKTCVLK